MTSTQPPASPPAKKKGLHPAAWVAIGCAGVLVVTAVSAVIVTVFVFNKVKDVTADFRENPAMGAAALLVRMNPELELLDRNDRAQKLTIRNKDTGQEAVFDLADVQQGRLAFRTPEGAVDLQVLGGKPADVPSWVPVFPGGEVQGGWSATADGERAGGFTLTAGRADADLFEFYRSRLEDAGFATQVQVTGPAGGEPAGTLIAVSSDERRGVSVVVAGSQAMINYTEKP